MASGTSWKELEQRISEAIKLPRRASAPRRCLRQTGGHYKIKSGAEPPIEEQAGRQR